MDIKDDILSKWINNELSEEEKKELAASGELAKLQKIWDALDKVQVPQYEVEDNLQRLKSSLGGTKQQKSRSLFTRYASIAASIAVLLLVSFLIFQYYPSKQEVISYEGQENVYLPDSSVINLNKGAVISYIRDNWGQERLLNLKGEAYFQVEKGSSFTVTTSAGSITVLGTKFNVKNAVDYLEVRCFEGSVAVTSTADQQQTLLEGDAIKIYREEMEKFSFSSAEKPSWMMDISTFYRTPFKYVVKEIEAIYSVEIALEKRINPEETFSGKIPHDDLEVALQAITKPSNYNFNLDNNQITIGSDQ